MKLNQVKDKILTILNMKSVIKIMPQGFIHYFKDKNVSQNEINEALNELFKENKIVKDHEFKCENCNHTMFSVSNFNELDKKFDDEIYCPICDEEYEKELFLDEPDAFSYLFYKLS